jgi:hypothetical protein
VPYLALFFRQELALAFLPPTYLAGLEAGGVRYRALTDDEIGTHYDRLVDRAGRLVGFQLWAVPVDLGLEGLLAAIGPRPYLEPLGGRPAVFRVHLGGAAREDVEDTGEQAFGGQLFRGDGGELALSIDLGYLCGGSDEEADLAAIRAAPATWLPVEGPVEWSAPEA